MSFEPPAGILDIGNATLRVGKLEVAETAGLNQGLQNIVKNDLLITETDSYTTSKSWGLKLPTTWVAEFDLQGQTGKYVEFNFYNEGSTSNTQGYTLNFKDTSLTLKYDNGNTLTNATIPTIVGTFRKVNIFFERGVIAVSIDGARVLYHKESDGFNNGLGVASRVVSTTGGAFLNAFIQSDHGGNSIFKNLRIVNGRFISDKTSNVSFIGSLGVGVNSPQEALDIRGNMHFNRVSNVSSVSVDSNVVAEYTGPHDRPLRKYPEVAMTMNSDKGYVVSASSSLTSTPAYLAFDGSTGSTWHTQYPYYTENGGVYDPGNAPGATGTHSGTLPSHELVSGYAGEYITLGLPNKIKMSKISINTRVDASLNLDQTQSAEVIVVVGSHDGSTWEFVDTHTVGKYPDDNTIPYTFNVNTSTYYEHVGLICTNTGPTDSVYNTAWSISKLAFYGYEEGSGSLDTTLKSVYNVPATTGTQLEVYYDAKDLATMPSTVTDLSPNTNGGSVTGVTLDETGGIESFNFDGNDYISTTVTGFTGTSVTMSVWVNVNSIDTSRINSIVGLGTYDTGTAGSSTWIAIDGSQRFYTGLVGLGQTVENTSAFTNNWVHLTVIVGTIELSLYQDGLLIGKVNGGTFNLGSNPVLYLGTRSDGSGNPESTRHFNGSIANFRLYSKALNADQVKELYDYQKDYFLGSKSQVTLYKGHLGVGVTEPSGQLELAGDERIQEYPPRALTGYETLVEGHGVFTASASSKFSAGFDPWRAFSDTNDYDNDIWVSGNNEWYTSNGYPSVLHYLADNTPGGAWIKIEMPYKIKLNSFSFVTGTRNYSTETFPENFQIWASNNGTEWNHIYSVSGFGNPPNETGGTTWGHTNVNSQTHYSMYAMVITKLYMVGAYTREYVSIPRWKLFGTPGPTTLDKGSLTLGRSLDVPRISRYDVDTETPRPEKLVVDYDTTVNSSPIDISGKGNHGRFYNGASYSAPDKAFSFDGTDDYIKTSALGFSGDQVHSISLWFWSDKPQTDMTTEHGLYGVDGSSSDPTARHGLSWWSPVTKPISSLRYWHSGSNGKNYAGVRFVQNTWNHIMVVYPGGGAFNVRIWLNGVEQQGTDGGSTNNDFAWSTTNDIILGDWYNDGGPRGESPWDGKISNFRVYNVALEPSEVKKLYNLGRTGRSMVISDTAVGIGKVPEAQLDVRGNLKVSGAISSNSPGWSYWRYTSADMNDVIYNSATDGPVGGFSTLGGFGQNWETGISGVITDRGTSRNFDPTTGTYTAPEKGVYMVNFTWSIAGGSGGDDSMYVQFKITGNPGGGDWETGEAFINRTTGTNAYLMFNPEFVTRSGIEECWSINDIVLLDTGSTINVRLENVDANTTLVMEKCNFSGFKIA